LRNGAVTALATIEASKEGIFRVLLVMRPSKLAAISRSADAKHRSESGSHTPAPWVRVRCSRTRKILSKKPIDLVTRRPRWSASLLSQRLFLSCERRLPNWSIC